MKKAAVIILFLLLCSWAHAAKPIIGVAGIRALSPREAQFSQLLEEHLGNIIRLTGIFDRVSGTLLKDQLSRFGCPDERCILGFANDAGISVIIMGSLQDLGTHMIITMTAYCQDVPYDGKAVYRYSVKVPIYKKHGVAEFSYICEEQAGHFFSGFLTAYKRPVYLESAAGETSTAEEVSGQYEVYRMKVSEQDGPRQFSSVGKAAFSAGKIVSGTAGEVRAGDFVLVKHDDKARFLKDFYYGRKKEVIFAPPSYKDALYMLLLTGPASALMPIAAPLFGYYRSADWTGLALWTLNVGPYLYFEINGFVHYPDQYRDKHQDISRQTMAQWNFAWYFAFAGGAALFVDAFANNYLKTASDYVEKRQFMGNALCAGYLALVSGGAGHFYRGHRFWGYFYFHMTNALLYLIINEFSPGEHYDHDRHRYVKESINETRGYTYVGIFCAVKIAEIVHAVLIKDNIRGGEVLEDTTTFEPVVYPSGEGLTVGVQCNYRF